MQCLLDQLLRLQERVQEAASGSPSQAKFRKGLETALDSPLQAKGSPLKSGTSVGTPKRAGSGFGDKVPRMTCWGTSDQPVVVKKPSLADRYSAWKVSRPLHCMSTIRLMTILIMSIAPGLFTLSQTSWKHDATVLLPKSDSYEAHTWLHPFDLVSGPLTISAACNKCCTIYLHRPPWTAAGQAAREKSCTHSKVTCSATCQEIRDCDCE